MSLVPCNIHVRLPLAYISKGTLESHGGRGSVSRPSGVETPFRRLCEGYRFHDAPVLDLLQWNADVARKAGASLAQQFWKVLVVAMGKLCSF